MNNVLFFVKIHFHGDDMNSLHSALRIEPALLPEFLGGTIGNEEYKDESVAKRILKKDPYYEGTNTLHFCDLNLVKIAINLILINQPLNLTILIADLLKYGYVPKRKSET